MEKYTCSYCSINKVVDTRFYFTYLHQPYSGYINSGLKKSNTTYLSHVLCSSIRDFIVKGV